VNTSTAPSGGTANTGGGAGGGSNGTALNGASGGSGVVIIRYPQQFKDITSVGSGLVYTKTESGGYKIYTFTSGTDSVVF
jgi:hypothetical protein